MEGEKYCPPYNDTVVWLFCILGAGSSKKQKTSEAGMYEYDLIEMVPHIENCRFPSSSIC
jgi:hypothetical protein